MRKKLLAMALSLCMIFTMLETTVFAVNEKFDLGKDVNTETAAEIEFGADGSGNPRLWRVIGYDGNGVLSTADNMTLLAKNNFSISVFDGTSPYTNNYSAISSSSTTESSLKMAIETSVIFTSAENGVIVPVNLIGGTDSLAKDGMYGDDVIGAKIWPLSVTEAKGVHEDLRKANNHWWLRSPGDQSYHATFVYSNGGIVENFYPSVQSNNLGVRPALKLNLESLLFASTISGGKSYSVGGNDGFSEIIDTALKLRFKDESVLNISNASVYATTSSSTITYTAPAESVLMLEVIAGGKTYQARKNIDMVTSNDTLDLKTIEGLPNGAVTGRIWIEKMEEPENNKGLIYAIVPTEVSYTSGISDAEKVSLAKTAIETSIFNLSVSNATTDSDILSVATGATLHGVNVAWDSTSGFSKTHATSLAVGSITGTLKLTLNGETNTISVNKTIAKLSSDNSGSSSGGGSSKGSGGSNIESSTESISANVTVIPPTPKNPEAPTKGEIKIPIVGVNGNFTAKLTDKMITEAFEKALADAKKNGREKNGIEIILRVDADIKTGTNITVNLPKTVQDTIISNKIVNTIVVGNNSDISVGMDLATVQEINRQANSDVNITATLIDPDKLSDEAKKAIGNRLALDFKVKYGNGNLIKDFGEGSVEIEIPYILGENENPENVRAVYIDDNGNVKWLENSRYDSTKKVVRFKTTHFSIYGIGYKQKVTEFTDIKSKFTDIESHWAKKDIELVVNRGLLGGTSANTFSPNITMTRGMFVTSLGRLANADISSYKNSSFNDVKNDAYYMGYIEWASKNKIINGVSSGKFAPNQPITREQMATIIQNYAKTINLKIPKNLFETKGIATRAEVSAILNRFMELIDSSK